MSDSSMSKEKNNAITAFLSTAKDKTVLNAIYGNNDYYGGEAAVEKVIDSLNDIDGIICESDALATGVVSKLLSKNISIPDKIKVVGFDNIPIAHMFHPALTTVSIPVKDMCVDAVKKAQSIFAGEEVSSTVFKPELIVRSTS